MLCDETGMARDHRRLHVFQLADQLAVRVYATTSGLPSNERYGLQSQIRRAAVSVSTNIVEGCARTSEGDLLRFIDIAFGSCREVIYLAGLAKRLNMLDAPSADELDHLGARVAAGLAALRRSFRP